MICAITVVDLGTSLQFALPLKAQSWVATFALAKVIRQEHALTLAINKSKFATIARCQDILHEIAQPKCNKWGA